MKIVAGTNLIHGGKEQVYDSEYVVSHKSWNTPQFSNDMGLIRVSKDIEFNDKVQPIKLPSEDFNKAGHPVVMSGWGTTIVRSMLLFSFFVYNSGCFVY